MFREIATFSLLFSGMGLMSIGQPLCCGIHGTVADQAGLPLPGVKVNVRGVSYSKDLTTDDTGYYRVECLPDGQYSLVFQFLGLLETTVRGQYVFPAEIDISPTLFVDVSQFTEKFPLRITVLDGKTGDPVPRAAVTIDGEAQQGTEHCGRTVAALSEGQYELVIRREGYKTFRQGIRIRENKKTVLEVRLKPTG